MRVLTKNVLTGGWYYKNDEKVDTYKEIGKAVNRLRFKTHIYNEGINVGYARIFQMVNDVRLLAKMPLMSREMFDEGFQLRLIFACDYDYAMEEFKLLCFGDW